MNFEIKGTYKQKKENVDFSKKVNAITEKRAREKTLAELGSNQKIKRRAITIISVQEVKA